MNEDNVISYGEGYGWQYHNGRISGKAELNLYSWYEGKQTKVVIIKKSDFEKIKAESKMKFKSAIPHGEGTRSGTLKSKLNKEINIKLPEYWDKCLKR